MSLDFILVPTRWIDHVFFVFHLDFNNLCNLHSTRSFLLSYQQLKHLYSCLTTSALREHFHKVLRETLQQFYVILKEIPCRPYMALRGLLHWTSRILTFNATRRQLVGCITIPVSTMAMIYANATLFFAMDSSFWVCNNSATGHICNDKSLFFGAVCSLNLCVWHSNRHF